MNTFKIIINKFHLVWVLVYLILIGGTIFASSNLYYKYNQDQLPDGSIEFNISKTKYQLGEPVEFTVINHFPTTIYVTNQCPGEPLNVYRWENNAWQQIHDKNINEKTDCSTEERNVGLQPEESKTYNFNDWPNLFNKPGTYRLAISVNYSDELLFQDFNILEPAKIIEIPNQVIKVNNPLPAVQPEIPVIIEPEPEIIPPPEEDDDYQEPENDNEREREREYDD